MKTFAVVKRSAPPPRRCRIPVPSPSSGVRRAEVRQILRGPRLQPKLTAGVPGDKFEREADRVADQVMRMPDSEVPRVTGDVAAGIRSLKGGGQPLPESERSFFEPRFGVDFSGVRVHTDAYAGDLAGRIEARAFTVGRDIVFAHGEYAPDVAGRKLLAHELTHTIQQTSASTSSPASSPQGRALTGQERPHAVRQRADGRATVQRAASEPEPEIGTIDRILLGEDLNKKESGHRRYVLDIVRAFRGARRYFAGNDWDKPSIKKNGVWQVPGDYPRGTLVSLVLRRPPKTPLGVNNQLAVWRRLYSTAQGLIRNKLNGQQVLTRALGTAYQRALDAFGNRTEGSQVFREEMSVSRETPLCFDFTYGPRCNPSRPLDFGDFIPQDGTDLMHGRDALTSASWARNGSYTATLDRGQTLMLREEITGQNEALLQHERVHWGLFCQLVQQANQALDAGAASGDTDHVMNALWQPMQDDYDNAAYATRESRFVGGMAQVEWNNTWCESARGRFQRLLEMRQNP